MGKPPRVEPARVGWERMHHPLLPWPAFVVRLLRSLALAAALIAVSLFAGMAGYHWLEHLGWLDSFLNAAMLLSGMGPLWSPISEAGKVFAGLYALYSGVAVLAFAGVIIAPIGHRLLHRFHAEEEPGEAAPDPQRPAPRNAKK